MKILASNPLDVIGNITPPSEVANITDKGGEGGISFFLNKGIELIFMVSAVVFVFMFLWGGLQWISSGGNKEGLAKAQSRIVNAIIGLVLLSLAFVIFKILGTITGFSLFSTPVSPPTNGGNPFVPNW